MEDDEEEDDGMALFADLAALSRSRGQSSALKPQLYTLHPKV